MRVNGPKSCRRPVVSLSHATKSYRVNQPLRDFPQAKLNSEINACFLLNEHGDLCFLLHNFGVQIILENLRQKLFVRKKMI